MGIGWELFECTACLPAGETGTVNRNGEIPGVPEKCDCSVPDGYTVWEFKMCLR